MDKENKIIIIGNDLTSFTGDNPDEKEISDSFNELGWSSTFIERNNWKRIFDLQDEYRYIFIAKNRDIFKEDVLEIKSKFTCPIIYWMPDQFDPNEIKQSTWRDLASSVDIWIGKDRKFTEFYESVGTEYLYWNHDVALKIYQPIDDPKILRHFTETLYPEDGVPVGLICNWTHNNYRTEFIYELQKLMPGQVHVTTYTVREFNEGQNCDVPGLENVHHPLFGINFSKLVGQTKVNVNLEHVIIDGFWSNRISRIMMSGGFVLTNYTKGMERVFKNNVVYFNTPEDCAKKAEYYLKNEEERKAIAKRGYEFAKQNLQTVNRVEELIIYLENICLKDNKWQKFWQG